MIRLNTQHKKFDPAAPTCEQLESMIPGALAALERALADVAQFTYMAEKMKTDWRAKNAAPNLASQTILKTCRLMECWKEPVANVSAQLKKWREDLEIHNCNP